MKPASKRTQGVKFASSPVLSVHLPMWRSKLVVFMLFIAFVALAMRAFWIQGPGNAFYQKQGESRYQRTLELPATRGKILDRNGLVLATSLPVRAIWAIPADVPDDLGADKLDALGKLLGMTTKELKAKLSEDKTFVYVKRQVPLDVAEQVAKLDIPGVYQRGEYKRFYPEGEITAHLIGFTNVEDEGQEGVELADQKLLVGTPGSRHVIKDRVGHIVEDVDAQVPPHNGADVGLSIDSKIQYITYTNLKAAVEKFHAKAGAAMVIDVQTGEVLSLVNYPTYNPNDRSHLTGEQLRNRVLTDVFEPGSIMKPFTVSLALDLHRVTPNTLVETGNGHFVLDGAPITDDSGFGTLTVGGVIQKSSNIGATKIAMTMKPEEMWNMYRHRARTGAEGRLSRRGGGPPAPVEELAAHRAGDDVVRLRPVGVAVPARARIHRDRARRRTDARDDFQDERRATPDGPARLLADDGPRSAHDARIRRVAAGYVTECGGARLSRRRQERYRLQAGRPRL